MDLLSSIRKSGSRGGVNFSWDEVSTSQHRENYLGHSLMAPVGRWQKNRDLNWYAKADDKRDGDETAEERKVRERKEEIRRIKEAEEDALARALGLPAADRSVGEASGANAISVGEIRKFIEETEAGDEEIEEVGRGRGFGDFVGKMADDVKEEVTLEPEKGGLVRKGREREGRRDDSRDRRHKKQRHRSRSRDRNTHRSRSGERTRHRSRSRERHRHGRRYDGERRDRSRSLDRRERRHRSRSGDRRRFRGDDRERRRDIDRRPRRSRSPDIRDSRGRGD